MENLFLQQRKREARETERQRGIERNRSKEFARGCRDVYGKKTDKE